MKTILTTTLLTFSVFLYSQNAKFEILNCKPIKSDFLWAATSEVSNFQYLEFLYSQKDNPTYQSLLPDTNCWKKFISMNAYTEYYLRHPAYRDYPVVGISKEQAEHFCKWLTKVLNEKYKKDLKHPVDSLLVRLPTEQEWEIAAKGGNPNALFPWDFKDMRHEGKKFKGQLLANFVRGKGDYMGVAGQLNDHADVTAPIYSYWPNAFGLYNMAGNVAEMIQEEGRTKGGSWASRAMYLEIDGKDEFEGIVEPDSRIGFRYFIEIRSFKNIDVKKKEELSAKMIEKLLIYVPGNKSFKLMSQTEVTNRLYNFYLRETKKERSLSSTSWESLLSYPSIWRNDYHRLDKYLDYPVVNISHEEAVAFCGWLTEKYQSFEKRKYKNVEFRLPTEEEWEYAARGGLDMSSYPWGGPYIRNAQGDFLCNHKAVYDKWILEMDGKFIRDGLTQSQLEEAAGLDGYSCLSPAYSFHPNGYGFYNMSGNVAEMIQESSISKGGSWNSFQGKVEIKAREQVTGPSPLLGFRIVGDLKTKETSVK